MTPSPVVLGEKYRDTITGFVGTATSRHEYLYGCVRVSLEGEVKEPGAQPQDPVFDEQRLVEADTEQRPRLTATSGGARTEPQRSVPSR